ncbi:hypothetical protein LPJ66_008227 [Kickxella alabastrina]|uniref:Uncharacterized protein n=1 Tax=Kickxella alabastrina TaxID=61397 RepID=A0ACC1IAF1_9FUNG|nr:hypothetical protein LPJ66_008227 [Kickxella alabastrina]
MSEEGEADFDIGQVGEEASLEVKSTAAAAEDNSNTTRASTSRTSRRERQPRAESPIGTECSAAAQEATSKAPEPSGGRRPSRGRSPGWTGSRRGGGSDNGDSGGGDQAQSARRTARSRSRSRSRSREYSRRVGGYTDLRYRGGGDEPEYRGSTSYRPGRYAEPSRPRYDRRYEREPRYRRRAEERLDDQPGRRDVDKERAIEELRLRVRGAADGARERSRSAARPTVSASAPAPASASAPAFAPATAVVVAESVGGTTTTNVDMDDIEEGEHIEGMEKSAAPEVPPRRSARERTRSCSRSRSYRAVSTATHDPEVRRATYRDHRNDYADRRDHRDDYTDRRDHRDDYTDRRDHRDDYADRRTREPYSRSTAYTSRYSEGRYAARSPEPLRDAYRSDRRHYAGRSDRYHGDRARSPTPRRRSRSRSQSRSRAAAVQPRDEEERRRHYAHSPRHASRSPRTGLDVADSANPPPPPPPPLQLPESPYRSAGYSSRGYRRLSRTPKSGSRYDTGHASRTLSPDANHMGSAQQPLQQQPPPPPIQQQQQHMHLPELELPLFAHGTDLFISRMPEAAEWLAMRGQVREQSRRILEASATARRSAFDLVHAGWAVLKAESQAQVACLQLERAEIGLSSATRSLMDTVELGGI